MILFLDMTSSNPRTNHTVPPDLDEILDGDIGMTVAQVTPLKGVVLTPVTNFGWDPQTQTITFSSDLAAFKKLRRIEQNPKVTVVFHAREHGSAAGDNFVLVQGEARFSWQPNRAELAALFDRWEQREHTAGRPGVTLGPTGMGGGLWNWWLGPFWWDRVVVRVHVKRIISFPQRDCLTSPTVIGPQLPTERPESQKPPGKGTGPRINVTRAAKQVRPLPHRLLGWVGADGYPVVVPVAITAASRDGMTVTAPPDLVPPGGRRAGLTGHWFSAGTLGQRQVVMTGWLTSDDTTGTVSYAPHTKLSYRLPPSRLLFRVVVGGAIRAGTWRARRAGIPQE